MNEKSKNVLKRIAIVVFIVVCFMAGFITQAVHGFMISLTTPNITSDTHIRFRMNNKGLSLPENAHHLYYASRFFVDAEHYAAFSLNSKEECENYLKELLSGYSSFRNSIKEEVLPVRLQEEGPDVWESKLKDSKYRDSNWQLKQGEKMEVYQGEGYMKAIIYVPKQKRLYFFWG